jgi:signal transduction histidine kinase
VKPYSLTRRLIAAVLLVELASALAFIALAGVYEGVSHFRAFDVMLRGRADSMLGAVQDSEDATDSLVLDGTQNLVPKRDVYFVQEDSGRILGQSDNWPDAQAFANRTKDREFSSLDLNGRSYRVIRETGLRMIDPGQPDGGVPHHVTIFYGTSTHQVWERIGHAIEFFGAASLILLAGTGLVMWWLLRRGLAPLHEIAGLAAQVSVRSWQFSPPPSARAVRELAPLVHALETALAGLELSFAQQTQFVSDAAHELKTSVAVVKSSLQVLMMRTRTPAEYEAGLERLQIDCARMEDLVASMLTLAGLESGDEESLPVAVDIADVVRDVVEQFHTMAQVAEIALQFQPKETVRVNADRERVRLLCSNLIHNALQHSSPGQTIRIDLHLTPQGAELRIIDQGSGIPAEALPHVFDRFYRSDPSRSRRTGGTGLGLAISRAIVTRFRGEIRLESEPGQGTTAVVRLPATPSVT